MATIKIFRSSRVRLPKASTTNPIYSAPPAATPKGLPAKALNLLNGTLPHISISGGCIPGRFRSCRHLHHSFHFIIIWTTTTGLPSSPHELQLEGGLQLAVHSFIPSSSLGAFFGRWSTRNANPLLSSLSFRAFKDPLLDLVAIQQWGGSRRKAVAVQLTIDKGR